MIKLKKRIISVVMFMFALLLFATPNVNAAESIDSEEIVIDILDYVPFVGEELTMFTLSGTEEYEIVTQSWSKQGASSAYDPAVGVEWQAVYIYELELKAKDGFEFVQGSKITIQNAFYGIVQDLYENGVNSSGNLYIKFGVYAFKQVPNIVIDGTAIASKAKGGETQDDNLLTGLNLEGIKNYIQYWSNKKDKFEVGNDYTFNLSLTVDNGYLFKENASITINGVNWKNTSTTIQNSRDVLIFNGTIECDTYGKVQLDGGELLPIVGEKAPKLSITSTEFEIVSQNWIDKNNNPVTTIDSSDTYTYELILKPLNYKFDDETTISFSDISWYTQDYSLITSGENAGCIKFTGTTKSNKIIKNIEIDVSSIKPKLGSAAGKVTIDSDEYTIDFQDWFDLTASAQQPITSFDEKTMYVYLLYIIPKDGYIFDTNASVNIKGITWDSVIDTYVDPYDIIYVAEYSLADNLTVSDGLNQTYTPEQKETITFTVNADVSKFEDLYFGGNALSLDDYEVTGDSNKTTITLKKSVLDTMLDGSNEVRAYFGDLGMATLSFIVEGVSTGSVPGIPEDIKNNPETNDNIMLYVIVLAVATIGIVTTTVMLNKKTKTKKIN